MLRHGIALALLVMMAAAGAQAAVHLQMFAPEKRVAKAQMRLDKAVFQAKAAQLRARAQAYSLVNRTMDAVARKNTTLHERVDAVAARAAEASARAAATNSVGDVRHAELMKEEVNALVQAAIKEKERMSQEVTDSIKMAINLQKSQEGRAAESVIKARAQLNLARVRYNQFLAHKTGIKPSQLMQQQEQQQQQQQQGAAPLAAPGRTLKQMPWLKKASSSHNATATTASAAAAQAPQQPVGAQASAGSQQQAGAKGFKVLAVLPSMRPKVLPFHQQIASTLATNSGKVVDAESSAIRTVADAAGVALVHNSGAMVGAEAAAARTVADAAGVALVRNSGAIAGAESAAIRTMADAAGVALVRGSNMISSATAAAIAATPHVVAQIPGQVAGQVANAVASVPPAVVGQVVHGVVGAIAQQVPALGAVNNAFGTLNNAMGVANNALYVANSGLGLLATAADGAAYLVNRGVEAHRAYVAAGGGRSELLPLTAMPQDVRRAALEAVAAESLAGGGPYQQSSYGSPQDLARFQRSSALGQAFARTG